MEADRRLALASRLIMAGVAVGLAGVIGLAVWLRPDPRGVGTHQQLGLPPCSFHFFLRVPCPSCGMTTSFAALVRGQVSASLKANAVGTLLAIGCLAMAPYLLVCAVWGKRLWVRDYEVLLARIIVLVMVLVFAGWGIRLGVRWLATGTVKDAPTRTAE